jgi:catechol 2,3-dioxygenase-like lactoylglutathione lyase family enzyme
LKEKIMLTNKQPVATIAVKDLATARRFYEEKLGLKPSSGPHEPTTITYQGGEASLFVYQSDTAGTNQATAVTWVAGDQVDETVRSLRKNAVAFESYDMPGGSKEGDVYVLGAVRIAWFKDPDGNIHAVVNG